MTFTIARPDAQIEKFTQKLIFNFSILENIMGLFDPEDRPSAERAREERLRLASERSSSIKPREVITFRNRNNQRSLSVTVDSDTGTQQALRKAFVNHVDTAKKAKQQNCQLLFDNIFSDPDLADFRDNLPNNPAAAIQHFAYFADLILKYWYFLQKDYVNILLTFFEITSEEKLKECNFQRINWLLETLILHLTANAINETNYQQVKLLHSRFANFLSGKTFDNSYTRTKAVIEKSFHSTLRDKCLASIIENRNHLLFRGKRVEFSHPSLQEICHLPAGVLPELYGNKCRDVLIFSAIPAEESIKQSSVVKIAESSCEKNFSITPESCATTGLAPTTEIAGVSSRTATEFFVETAKVFGLWISTSQGRPLFDFFDTRPVIPAIQSAGGGNEIPKEEIPSSNVVRPGR